MCSEQRSLNGREISLETRTVSLNRLHPANAHAPMTLRCPQSQKGEKQSGATDAMASGVSYPLQLSSVGESHAALYEESLKQPERFWGDLASRRLRWIKPFDQVMDCDMSSGHFKWFLGGTLNVSGELLHSAKASVKLSEVRNCAVLLPVNCLDRHVEENADKPAFKDERGTHEIITYGCGPTLYVCMYAQALHMELSSA